MIYRCPLCREPLLQDGKSFLCVNHHTFDQASEGYVNLLPVQKKNSKSPGDDKRMVSARRQFLEAGYYRIFSDGINRIIYDLLKDADNSIIVDAGCGEGYYTGRLHTFLTKNGLTNETAGFDISREAVRLAAKKYKDIQWAVSSIFDIPIRDAAADVVLNIFAPIVPGEFRRILKPGGCLVVAVPGERHLYGLKEILYDNVYENEKIETEYEGFEYLGRTPFRGNAVLDQPEMIHSLFIMTPYFWKTPCAGSERLKTLVNLRTEICFDILVYRAD